MIKSNFLKVALAQISPVWLDKKQTIQKIKNTIEDASKEKAELIVFGEALLPGYPFWIGLTNGAAWNSSVQKEIHAHYVQNSITIEKGELDTICKLAKEHHMAIYIGIIERAQNRGGHSIYASLVYINQDGVIKSVHRKLQPTYDERLTWAPGDGHGLQVHPLKNFTIGGLNCWENWMPLPRAALYGQGEDLHVAVWPGSDHNTKDITRFIARESRSFVISVSSLMQKSNFPKETPHFDKIIKNAPDTLVDGEWILEPVINKEGIFYETLDFSKVLEERQNFDVVGHYSRPDITKLHVNRDRQSTVSFDD